ncbi:acyl carrier protein [Oscillibacter sp. 1-3]|uniref:acyl carrier protein n=1 Tax=Oscillibacter sp. 1-3 TaxID=1235797 RepID=UPI00033FCDAC|nr:acyl carrier protein [Oscillibacter sp. 1-3]EOS63224.1 hypothetical protein C816_03718 [Oscillibacter sp. 1-3]
MKTILQILSGLRPEFDFSSSRDFIDDGYLDSFDIVALISELEETFHILIDGMDVLPENFCSVEAIAATVRKNGGTLD